MFHDYLVFCVLGLNGFCISGLTGLCVSGLTVPSTSRLELADMGSVALGCTTSRHSAR